VSTRSPSNFGFALLKTIRTPVANRRSRYGDEGVAAAMKVAPVARNGTGWSDVNQIGGIYTARFTAVGGENCKALFKLGRYGMAAFCGRFAAGFCGIQGNNVQDRDLQSFVDALIVKAQ
jgi:hypothetical protein